MPVIRSLAALGLLLTAGGCGGVPLAPEVPPAFDLNGHWVLRPALSDPPPNQDRLRAQADRALLGGGLGRNRGLGGRAGLLAFVVQDFPVLAAKSMVIEQDTRSMGVRYDNGAYRDVSWGQRKRGLWQVSAGWLEGNLVIDSKAADAAAKETLSLSDDGRRMAVVIEVKSGGGTLNAVRTFDRVSP